MKKCNYEQPVISLVFFAEDAIRTSVVVEGDVGGTYGEIFGN